MSDHKSGQNAGSRALKKAWKRFLKDPSEAESLFSKESIQALAQIDYVDKSDVWKKGFEQGYAAEAKNQAKKFIPKEALKYAPQFCLLVDIMYSTAEGGPELYLRKLKEQVNEAIPYDPSNPFTRKGVKAGWTNAEHRWIEFLDSGKVEVLDLAADILKDAGRDALSLVKLDHVPSEEDAIAFVSGYAYGFLERIAQILMKFLGKKRAKHICALFKALDLKISSPIYRWTRGTPKL